MRDVDRTSSLYSLEELRKFFGFHPWHFWQIGDNGLLSINSHCETLTFEHAWQMVDATGRSDLRVALQRAEERLKEVLGFAVRPQFESEDIQYPMFYDVTDQYLAGIDGLGRWMGLKVSNGYVLSPGLESRTLLDTPSITYSDSDGDSLLDTATITATVPSGTTTSSIALYVPDSERYDDTSLSERWRILPLRRVTINNTTATIILDRWQLVRPILYSGPSANMIDPSNAGNFLTTIDVCRYAADTTQQGRLFWESVPSAVCATNGTDPSSVGEFNLRSIVRNSRLGWLAGEAAQLDTTVSPNVWVAVNWPYSWAPQRVEVNYLAGWNNDKWATVVFRLAAAEAGKSVCACREANREWSRWQDDLANTQDREGELLSQGDLDNPFGTRRGQIYAWHAVSEAMIAKGTLSA